MKKTIFFAVIFFIATLVQGQTSLQKTSEQFRNGKSVWDLLSDDEKIGEFWPINGLNLVTKETDPDIFSHPDITAIQASLRGIATAPDGMTAGSLGSYRMEGKSLSHGRPCGDGFVYQYGIVCVSPNGYSIQFTHANEVKNFDSLYAHYQQIGATLFFLPSIFRNGNFLSSEKMIDKVLVRRTTYDGEQIGVILFDQPTTCNKAREIILGLDRPGRSQTTHIYVLDGGPAWGQACKETNGTVTVLGTRDPRVVTNYLVFY
ncbi:MAG: hypothetical protein V4665_04040 [Patescibacteria group bacterium]